MSVDLARLTDALSEYSAGGAFLITVGAKGTHTVMTEPVFAGGVFDVGEVGTRTGTNVATHPEVTLLWPPRSPGGYALMVDGRAESVGEALRVVPTKALLHRKAAPGSPAAESGCLHDCVVFKA